MIPTKSPAPVAIDAPQPALRPPVPQQVTKKSRPRTIQGLSIALKLNP